MAANMVAILLPLLKKFGVWLLAIGLVIGLFLWGRHYQLDDRQKGIQLAQANQELSNIKADYQKYQTQQVILLQQERERQTKTITIVKKISDAKETHSCASSPAITALLNGLREHNNSTLNSIEHASMSGSTRGSDVSHR